MGSPRQVCRRVWLSDRRKGAGFMDRLTRKNAAGVWELDPERLPEAAERLARYEDFVEALPRELGQISAELEALRGAGKEKTVQFRERMARKLTDRSLLLRLEEAGLTGR